MCDASASSSTRSSPSRSLAVIALEQPIEGRDALAGENRPHGRRGEPTPLHLDRCLYVLDGLASLGECRWLDPKRDPGRSSQLWIGGIRNLFECPHGEREGVACLHARRRTKGCDGVQALECIDAMAALFKLASELRRAGDGLSIVLVVGEAVAPSPCLHGTQRPLECLSVEVPPRRRLLEEHPPVDRQFCVGRDGRWYLGVAQEAQDVGDVRFVTLDACQQQFVGETIRRSEVHTEPALQRISVEVGERQCGVCGEA